MGVLLFATKFIAPGGLFYMKLSILDYHQKIAVAYGLDMNDLILLRWFVDFRNTDRMQEAIFNDTVYYWVNYEKVIDDLPILKINNKIALRRRFKKLCDCKVLEFHLEKNSKGTFTYYRTGIAYKTLLYDMLDRKHFE